jgi:nitric oxide reductase NorD protein
MTVDNAFDALIALDPELAATFEAAGGQSGITLSADSISDIIDTILNGYQQEIHFGQTLAEGYCKILQGGTPEAVTLFGREIRHAAHHSAALGCNLAIVLPPVLLTHDNDLLAAFQKTLAILLSKGDYLVKAPMEGLAAIVSPHDDTGQAYLELLQTVFDRPLSYNRCQYMGRLLPRAIQQLPARRRSIQIRQMTRLIRADLNLAEPYLEGLSQGLDLLSANALEQFIDQALDALRDDPQTARRFVSLRSGHGRETCRLLQTAVTLHSAQTRLNRYLQARTGKTGRVRPLSAVHMPIDRPVPGGIQSGTDGVHLYLPDAVDCFATRTDNTRLLNVMVKFEAGLIEFDTFTFDLERARDMGCLAGLPPTPSTKAAETLSDFSTFSQHFNNPRLALDLFTIFEHARIRVRLTNAYPGLVRDGLPLFQDAMAQAKPATPALFLDACYGVLALNLPIADDIANDPTASGLIGDLVRHFSASDPPTMRVEHCAGLVIQSYERVRQQLATGPGAPAPLSPPYRLPLQPELIDAAFRDADHQAGQLIERLKACGLKIYRGDLRQLLQHTAGRPAVEAIGKIVCRPPAAAGAADTVNTPIPVVPSPADILGPTDLSGDIEDPEDVDRITWQKEWNTLSGDYLHDHVRVRDRRLGGTETTFYETVLTRCDGLVRQIKNAFELLRPEGISILRPWVEGDDFDYRALLDVALDRKAGLLPSDRLYIKRVKQRRDVAVMLLVDLSRSTSNIVKGAHGSVLDVTKEAIVLFTQALEVVGDAYAVAGFSGTGRLGVDFFRIKDFDEPLSANIKGTLGALTPQRSTRMGAAVRRASRELMAQESRVRLLLLIGDGFPNDTDYKGDYAVQDTRQAIAEARSHQIITQAITVNLPASPQLDDLYGQVRHTVISEVNELPDKLLRLYGALTRH